MTAILCTLLLQFVAFSDPSLPIVMPPSTQGLSPADAVFLDACFDPDLGTLRAGSVEAPAPFGACERTVLASAEQSSTSLDALRAGASPSDNEWTWLAIGAGIVILIVLL